MSRSERRKVAILHHPLHRLLKTKQAYRRHHSILRRYTRFHFSKDQWDQLILVFLNQNGNDPLLIFERSIKRYEYSPDERADLSF